MRRKEAPGAGQNGFRQAEAMLGGQVGSERHAAIANDRCSNGAMLMPEDTENVQRERPQVERARGAMEGTP